MSKPYWDDQFRETESERVERWRRIKEARREAGLCVICAKASCKCAQPNGPAHPQGQQNEGAESSGDSNG